ncbi:MAG: gephyrin-like molybdotransferase Glp [Albidovulum sp.]
MISVDEALARTLALCPPLGTQMVPLRAAHGRVMAQDAVTSLTQPPFAASAMDGYAIREADHQSGKTLQVVGEASAGHGFGGQIGPGQCARIFTGAPVPKGAERVILQEDVTRQDTTITLGERLEQSRHIRPAGQDFKAGDRLTAPRRLRPADVALLASMNIAALPVAKRPEVAIMATGDELVSPGDTPGPDQIIASNSYGIAALAEAAGAKVRMLPITRDNEASLRFAFALAARADIIVTSGGASVGDHDLVGKVAHDMGMERAFWKISMRPGKPLMVGRLGHSVLLGLPGNPVSSIVCAHLFLVPMLAHLQGLPGQHDIRKARLTTAVDATGPRTHYMRARLSQGADMTQITPFDRQDSALLSILSQADALLIRPLGDGPRAAGTIVDYLPI